MEVDRDNKGRLAYTYTTSEGKIYRLAAEEVLHIPGLGFDGVVGYSPIALEKNAIGLGLAAEEYGSKFFSNGARPSGILTHPNTVKNPKILRESWNAAYGGSSNSGRVAILEEGMKFETISMPNNEGMDEGALTEYLGVLTQIQALLDSGMSQEQVSALFPEIDFTMQMDQIAALTQFVTEHQGTLTGLSAMFTGALPDEVLKIATDLDMTGAQTRWSEFASNPGAITTQAVVDGYTESETAVTEAAFMKKNNDRFQQMLGNYLVSPE